MGIALERAKNQPDRSINEGCEAIFRTGNDNVLAKVRTSKGDSIQRK